MAGEEEDPTVAPEAVDLTLVGEEIDGWESLGLQPPKRDEAPPPEQQLQPGGLLLPAGDAATLQLTNVLSVIALHLEESDRRWEQQQRENADVRRQLEEARAGSSDLARQLEDASAQVAMLSGRLMNVESTCKKLADDTRAMGASIREESARIEQQVQQVTKTMSSLESVPARLASLRTSVGQLWVANHAVEAQAEHALHAVIADGAASAVLERAEAEGAARPPALSVLHSRAAVCARHTARPFGGDGPVSVRGAFLAWRALLPRLGNDEDWRSGAVPLEDAAAAARLGRLQERVAERVEARWRLYESSDRLRTSVDGVRDAGAVEQTRATQAEEGLRQALDGGLSEATKSRDLMREDLLGQMVNIGHLEELQKKMDKVTADAGGANDAAKSAVNDAREAMRLIYDLSKKVEETDPDVIKEQMASLDAAVQMRAEKTFVEESVSTKAKDLKDGFAKEMKQKANIEETKRAMSLVTGLGERVDGLSGLNTKMDRVEANTDKLTNQYDNRLLSLEGELIDKAGKEALDKLQARAAKLEAQVRELQDESDEEYEEEPEPEPEPVPVPAPAPAPAPPPATVTRTVPVAGPASAPAPAPVVVSSGPSAAAMAKSNAEAAALRQAQERTERQAKEDRERQKKEREKEKAERCATQTQTPVCTCSQPERQKTTPHMHLPPVPPCRLLTVLSACLSTCRKKLVTKKELEKKLSRLAGRISAIDSALAAAEANPPGLAALMPGSSAFRCLACDAPIVERGTPGDFLEDGGATTTVQIPGAVSQLYGASARSGAVASFMDGSDAMGDGGAGSATRPGTAPAADVSYSPPVWTN
jgi:hypothetical protein